MMLSPFGALLFAAAYALVSVFTPKGFNNKAQGIALGKRDANGDRPERAQ
jgi:hypothetical protein